MNRPSLLKNISCVAAGGVTLLLLLLPGGLRVCESAQIVDRIVAVVNDDIIQLSELDKAFAPYEKQIRAKGYPPEKELETIYNRRMEMLNDLIDDKLADQEIKNAGITVSEKEVDNAIEQVKAMNHYTDETFRRALAVTGLDMARYRKEIKQQILRNKLVNYRVKSKIVITKADIKAYYDSHPEDYAPKKQYRLKNILMHYPASSDEETGETNGKPIQLRMAEVLQHLKDGADFGEMARKYSQAVNSGDGGELGLFSADELSGKIRAVVLQMQAGEFSPIVETDQGYQIFYLEKIIEGPGRPLADASDEILKKLYNQSVNDKFKAWIGELRKNADIKIVR